MYMHMCVYVHKYILELSTALICISKSLRFGHLRSFYLSLSLAFRSSMTLSFMYFRISFWHVLRCQFSFEIIVSRRCCLLQHFLCSSAPNSCVCVCCNIFYMIHTNMYMYMYIYMYVCKYIRIGIWYDDMTFTLLCKRILFVVVVHSNIPCQSGWVVVQFYWCATHTHAYVHILNFGRPFAASFCMFVVVSAICLCVCACVRIYLSYISSKRIYAHLHR